jgi:ligand-binding sensor domain-containing protein/AraC-like DNA-binding protein
VIGSRLLKIIAAAGLCLLLHQPAPGASFLEFANRRYIVTAWTVEDGLPQNSVLTMTLTRGGYIWFGTRTGLVRFDGVKFRIYNRWNTPGLKSDRILCLYEDHDGVLWIGTDGGGVSRLKNDICTAYTVEDGLSGSSVRALAGDGGKGLWIGTDRGLNRLEQGKISVHARGREYPVFAISSLAVARSGALWIGTAGGGLQRLENNRFQPTPRGLEDALFGTEIVSLLEDRSGTLWIGTDDGLYRLENNTGKTGAPPPLYLSGSTIRTILEDDAGNLWVGTDGEGIHCLRKNGDAPGSPALTTRQGLPDDFIHTLMQDREGNIWLGTYTTGLVRLKKSRVRTITTAGGLPENKIHTIIQDSQGCLWVGTDRKGAAKIKDNRLTGALTRANGLCSNAVRALYLDRDNENHLWVGTTRGLNRVNTAGGQFPAETFTTAHGLSSNQITAIYRDRNGSLWIGAAGGLNREDNGKFTVPQQLAGLTDTPVRVIAEDRDGSLHVGTRAGLFTLDSGKFRQFTGGFDVLAVHQDRNGHLWIGTGGSGLIRYENSRPDAYAVFTEEDGLPNNYIFSITEANSGDLWMSSYNGVFVLRAGERHGGDTGGPAILRFDEKEGMRSRECVMTGHPSAWYTASGELYIPTIDGAAVFNPGTIVLDQTPPAVVIENVFADNRSIRWNSYPTLPTETGVIEFSFTALSFTAPEKLIIRYKLDGFDDRWREAAPRQERMALYLNLPPGSYRFNVIARSGDGAWNLEGDRFAFRIKAPFHRQPLFYGLLVIFLGLAGGGGWLLRQGKKKQQTAGAAKTKSAAKYKTSALLPETAAQTLPRLHKLMEEEKRFLDPDLTLKKLATQLNIHYNHLSRIINEHMGKNFNDYVNSYRIEEAKAKLLAPGGAGKTVLEIAYDTGFYSKSVFNTAFKKFTGMTPSQFKKAKGKAAPRAGKRSKAAG